MKWWEKTLTILGIMGLSALLLIVFPTSQLLAGGKGGPYYYVHCDQGQSIQDAINKANEGAWIGVYGTCTEQVTIDKDRIWLIGQPGANISSPEGSWATIRVTGSQVKIANFTSIEGGPSWNGILVHRGGSAIIKNNEAIKNCSYGIHVNYGGFAEITNNLIKDNTIHGIEVGNGSAAEIDNNTIMNNVQSGVYIWMSSSARITNNSISGNGTLGIGVVNSSSASIEGNTVNDNDNSGIGVVHNSSIILPDWGDKNNLDWNAYYGVRCGVSGDILVQNPPEFGNNNTPGNTYIHSTCDCTGAICP